MFRKPCFKVNFQKISMSSRRFSTAWDKESFNKIWTKHVWLHWSQTLECSSTSHSDGRRDCSFQETSEDAFISRYRRFQENCIPVWIGEHGFSASVLRCSGTEKTRYIRTRFLILPKTGPFFILLSIEYRPTLKYILFVEKILEAQIFRKWKSCVLIFKQRKDTASWTAVQKRAKKCYIGGSQNMLYGRIRPLFAMIC